MSYFIKKGFTQTPNFDVSLQNKRGFTLIELLIAIAIVGIISSVVLSSLNTARGKGANAAIKSNLNNIRAASESFYNDNNGFYNNVCANSQVRRGLDAAGTLGLGGLPANAVCNSNSDNWAASSPLKVPDAGGFTYWCIDNSGIGKGENATLGGAIACP